MKHSIVTTLIITSFAMTLGSGRVEAEQQTNDTQQQLLACQKLEKPEEQLACFNRIASAVKPAESKPQKPAKDNTPKPTKPVPSKVNNSTSAGDKNFGLSSDAIAKRDGTSSEPEAIQSEVIKWRRMFNRRFEVTLANGQVWQETSGSKLRFPSNKNLKVTITESWTGGYRMKFEGIKKPAKVKRVK